MTVGRRVRRPRGAGVLPELPRDLDSRGDRRSRGTRTRTRSHVRAVRRPGDRDARKTEPQSPTHLQFHVPRTLTCPRCDGRELDLVGDPPQEIDACSSCRGIWLDAAEWGSVIGPAASPSKLSAVRATAPDAAPCPACAAARAGTVPRLQPRMIVGADDVVLDACPSCRGAWLDGGELAALKRSLAASRARMPAPPPPSPGAAAAPGPSQRDAGRYMTMGAAMASTALDMLAQAATMPTRRRGFFRRRMSGVDLVIALVRMLTRR